MSEEKLYWHIASVDGDGDGRSHLGDSMYTKARWNEFVAALTAGDRCQIDAEIYEHFLFLEVPPPRWVGKTVKVSGEWIYCNFGIGEGCDLTTYAFWTKDGQYFCQEEDQ